MTSALNGRVKRLEADQREKDLARWNVGIDTLRQSMDREHVAFVRDWMREHCGGLTLHRTPGESWYALLKRLKPPALVRAMWLMMAHHMGDGTALSLAPTVAEIYLDDSDAYPINPCLSCGYLLPARARIKADDGCQLLSGWYMGECPVCGLDNHPDDSEDA
jgi:hypothetical protein